MSRRTWIVFLAGVNLLLLAAVILSVASPPVAIAQEAAAGRARGDVLLVAAEAERSNDVVYLIDGRSRRMYAFRPTYSRQAGAMAGFALLDQRDLADDFRRGR